MPLLKKPGHTTGIGSPSSSAQSRQQPPGDGEPTGGADATSAAGAPLFVLPGQQMLPAGTVLQNRYIAESAIGVGGMSAVYRGRDLRFKDVVRTCAIKEMYQAAPDSQTRLLRLKNFEREAGLLATLSHTAIPKVYDFFEENGKIYLIMELVPGRDLEATLREANGPIDEERVGQWALQICDVLDYLHTHEPPIIFRDLKPSNIMVTPQDRIVLIDFGIARLFRLDQRKGTMIGTEGYAPPEQYRGIGDPRGDLYALGATMHHLLTGVDPRTETPFTFHERPIRQYNPTVSPEMEAIVMRTLEYDLKARPASAAEMKALLLTVPSLARSDSPAAVGSTLRLNKPAAADRSTAKLVWKFTCEDEVRSSPYIRDGLLYIGSYDTHLYCLNASSGKLRWKQPTLGGVSSSPVVWNDLAIAGSEDGQIYAMDARMGDVIWTFRTGRAVRSSPKVEDRIVYVGSDDQHVYAIDGLNGRLLWQYRTWMAVRSSCAISSAAVYVGSSDGHIYSLGALDGMLRWKQRTQQSVVSTPALASDMVFVGSMDGILYALDAESGRPVWRFKTGHYVNSSPAIFGTRVLVGSVDGSMYAVDVKTGRQSWKYDTGSQITSSPRVSDGNVYFGATDGIVYKLDATSGALLWKYVTGGPVVSSAGFADGNVYIGSLDHHVYAFEA